MMSQGKLRKLTVSLPVFAVMLSFNLQDRILASRFEGLAVRVSAANVSPLPTPTPVVQVTQPTIVDVPTTLIDGGGSQLNPARSSAHVLVALRGNYQPEGELDKAAIKVQRDAIAAAQNRVIVAINAETGKGPNPNARARVKRRYVTVPGLALELRPAVITELQSLPDVFRVSLDTLNRPTLSGTTGIVGSKFANHAALGATGRNQVVAVLDTGVDRDHPFLGLNRVVANACFSTSSWWSNDEQTLCPNGEEQQFGGSSAENCTISNACDHGTHVAGIVGGFTDSNGNGAIDLDDRKGVAPRVKFVPMQIFTRINNRDSCGNDSVPCIRTFDSDIIAGLDRVEVLLEDHDIAAVNLSVGGGGFTSTCDTQKWLMKWAIDDLRSLKTATVVASGNDGFSNALSSPACISSAISVGNTTDADLVNSSSNTASFLKLLAPGTSVTSSVPGTGFANMTGTSMAAPHVAGTWALMKQLRSARGQSVTVSAILSRLEATGPIVTNGSLTKPRVDVMNALDLHALEILMSVNSLSFSNAQPITRTVTLARHNFSGELNIQPTIVSGASNFNFTFSNNPASGNSTSMTITPTLSANGSYTLSLRGTNSPGTVVFEKRVTLTATPPAPVVTSFTPTSAPATTWITINGQNFSQLTEVQFSGANRVRPTVDSSSSIRVRVPNAAATGPVRVFNGNRVTTAGNFTLTTEPVIVSLTPNFAPVGARIAVNGVNFGASPNVSINGVAVTGLSVTATTLAFNVPQTSQGAHTLRVSTIAGNVTRTFTVGFPIPTIARFLPEVGMVGGPLTISGSGFYGAVRVFVCDIQATTSSINPTEVRAVVPSGIEHSCTIKVRTFGGTAQAGPFVDGQ